MARYDENGNIIISPIIKEPKKRGGKSPRQAGNRVEKIVARAVGGDRVPGSGSIKNTNHNLKGDVEVKDTKGRQFIKLEVKMTGTVTAKGEKIYALAKSTLDQMVKEAEEVGEIGALVLHFKGQSVDEGYTIMQNKHFWELVDLAKVGHAQV